MAEQETRELYERWVYNQMGCEGPVPELPTYEEWLSKRTKHVSNDQDLRPRSSFLSDDVIKVMRKVGIVYGNNPHLFDGSPIENYNGWSEEKRRDMTFIAQETYKLSFDLTPEEESSINLTPGSVVAFCEYSKVFVYK